MGYINNFRYLFSATFIAFLTLAMADTAMSQSAELCFASDRDEIVRIEACTSAIEENPTIELYLARGRLFERLNDPEAALNDFGRVLELDAENLVALERRMVLLNKNGQAEAALVDAETLVRLEPDHRFNFYYLGEVHRNLASYDDAIEAYNQSLSIDPNYYWAHVGRGIAFEAMGQKTAAAQSFHRATFEGPFESYARRQAQAIFLDLEDAMGAAHHMQFRYTLNPNQLSLRDWLKVNVWEGLQVADLPAWDWVAPNEGIEYLSIRSKVDQRDEIQQSIEDLIVFFGGEVYPKADRAVIERYSYEENQGDFVPVNRSVIESREGEAPTQKPTPGTYRGLFPVEIFPFGPEAPAVRAVYDRQGINSLWPLKAGNTGSGTGRFIVDCTDAKGMFALMMGCLPEVEQVEVGQLEWKVVVEAEATHVPMGVFQTLSLHLSQSGSVTILGKTNDFPLEVKFWISPELGTWVRRHIYMGEDFILSQALRSESDWTELAK